MTTIHLFPGQGSQIRGMGRDIFPRFPAQVREADTILGYSIEQLCLEDDGTRLNRTEFTQPALYTVCALTWLARIQDEGAPPGSTPDFVAGHSLGEYAALFAAEAFDFATGLRLVQRRGALMGAIEGGGMTAILRLPIDRLQAMLANGFETIDIANLNSPTQTVLAGPVTDLQRLAPLIEAEGGLAMPLNVRTAFHSRHMRSVREAFAETLEATPFQPLMLPVIANTTARPYRDADIAITLAQQIDHPVRWTETIRYLLAEPTPTFTEIGPGQVLTRLVKDILKNVSPPS